MRQAGACIATGQVVSLASVLSLRYDVFPKNLIYEKLGIELERQRAILKGKK